MMVKKGSRWWVADGRKFVIIDEVDVDGHTWVHYRDELGDPPKEYSCYKESFTTRFSPLPD